MVAPAIAKAPRMSPAMRAILRRVGQSLLILLVIAFLTLFGLIVGERGRAGLPARPLDAAVEALGRTFSYIVQHPATYYWHRADVPAAQVVLTLLGRSAGLLGVALFFAAILGVPLGILAALSRRVRLAPLVVLTSILGTSVPSFLLAMFFWIGNVQLYRWLDLNKALLPQVGFGWDTHMIMPALVLATRPLAQIVQITYVSMSSVLKEDYVQTARGKGLPPRIVLFRHALRNALTPILTTMGTSLRFSLASLPVVEFFFVWPGVGATLLQAIEQGEAPLVTDLIVSLGLLFLLLNLALEVVYRVIDPRLRNGGAEEAMEAERRSWREHLSDLGTAVSDLAASATAALKAAFSRPQSSKEKALPLPRPQLSASAAAVAATQPARPSQARHILQSAAGNLPLIAGTLLVLAFLGLALFGPRLTSASPYETHSMLSLEEAMGAPPFKPSSVFPWGSDVLGRDMQALVLAGARQTLTLALAAMLARVLLGTVLGVLAGWWQRSWLDRLVTGAIDVWAAFPVTLFAMILILGLGIKQGMPVFVAALCIVGWGEIAQFVRGQVIALKPQPFIEAARAAGARPTRILTWHVLPHLLSPLLVLAVLETGGILMLLAELGFLNIFLGGGFKVMYAEGSMREPIIAFFSDVPEWGALLANIRDYWRSCPWMAWYPGIAFFLAILAFNLWGEGLRRFLEETRINVARLLNRYTLAVVAVLALGVAWSVRSASPIEQYRPQALQFDAQRAMADVRALAAPELDGREQGLPGAQQAAEYIARRMEEIGLFPAGDHDTYIQTLIRPVLHLEEPPRLEALDEQGGVAEALVYWQDFAEYVDAFCTFGEGQGPVVGLACGPDPQTQTNDPYGLRGLDLGGKVVVTRLADVEYLRTFEVAGMLFVCDDPAAMQKKQLLGGSETIFWLTHPPAMAITPAAADRLLASAGSSLAELDRTSDALDAGQAAVTGPGATVRVTVPARLGENPNDLAYNTIGYIPGTGAQVRTDQGESLDKQVIMVAAHYDGLGRAPGGTLYPGANDNASGVAAMLEMARILEQSPYAPKKTVVFVAWTGGERGQSLSVVNVMNAKAGFAALRVEAIIELSGLGAGDGQGLALGQGTSFRLVQLFQAAARRLGVSTTTRGRGPHYGLFVQPGFGGRDALSAYVSWDGSDQTAHTPADTVESLDAGKLAQSGQTALLVASVLSREERY